MQLEGYRFQNRVAAIATLLSFFNMFQDWFVSRRELKRLATSVDYWRDRALSYEQKLESQRETMQAKIDAANRRTQETLFSCLDRAYTVVQKTHAVGDEIKRNALKDDTPQAVKNEYEVALKAHLDMRRAEWDEKVLEAAAMGVQSNADNEFAARREQYISEFDSSYFPDEVN